MTVCKPFIATMDAVNGFRGPSAVYDTIAAARRYAESYGDTAELFRITDATGQLVAVHRRVGATWHPCHRLCDMFER